MDDSWSEAAGCGVLDAAAVESAFGGSGGGGGGGVAGGGGGVRARAEWVRRQAAVLTEALWAVHDVDSAAGGAGGHGGERPLTPHSGV